MHRFRLDYSIDAMARLLVRLAHSCGNARRLRALPARGKAGHEAPVANNSSATDKSGPALGAGKTARRGSIPPHARFLGRMLRRRPQSRSR